MPYAPSRLERLSTQPERSPAPHRRIYKTAAWLRFRAYRLSLNPICQRCEAHGLVSPSVDVHHIIALRDGGEPYALSNTECLCHSCHSAMTRAGQ